MTAVSKSLQHSLMVVMERKGFHYLVQFVKNEIHVLANLKSLQLRFCLKKKRLLTLMVSPFTKYIRRAFQMCVSSFISCGISYVIL